jgi:hypothetical protein
MGFSNITKKDIVFKKIKPFRLGVMGIHPGGLPRASRTKKEEGCRGGL